MKNTRKKKILLGYWSVCKKRRKKKSIEKHQQHWSDLFEKNFFLRTTICHIFFFFFAYLLLIIESVWWLFLKKNIVSVSSQSTFCTFTSCRHFVTESTDRTTDFCRNNSHWWEMCVCVFFFSLTFCLHKRALWSHRYDQLLYMCAVDARWNKARKNTQIHWRVLMQIKWCDIEKIWRWILNMTTKWSMFAFVFNKQLSNNDHFCAFFRCLIHIDKHIQSTRLFYSSICWCCCGCYWSDLESSHSDSLIHSIYLNFLKRT